MTGAVRRQQPGKLIEASADNAGRLPVERAAHSSDERPRVGGAGRMCVWSVGAEGGVQHCSVALCGKSTEHNESVTFVRHPEEGDNDPL